MSQFLLILVSAVFHLFCGCLGQEEKAGVHCGTVSILDPSTNTENDVYRCVECTFLQNCLKDNICKNGSFGEMCEKCQTGYHHVGNQCSQCPVVPWSAVTVSVYFLLLVVASCYNGFTEYVSTKMRLLCYFVQHVYLTFLIKLPWPKDLTAMAAIITFGSFDGKVAMTECLFPGWPIISKYYLDWLITLLLPIFTIMLGAFLDRSMRTASSADDSNLTSLSEVDKRRRSQRKRTVMRRLVVMVIWVMYMPSTLSAVQTFQCAESLPETIHFFATLYLIIVGMFFPLMLVFFTLRQRKWDLLHSCAPNYGPVYDAYKDKYCFWEAIPLLRTLVAILTTELSPLRLSAYLQTLIQLGLTAVYLCSIVILRPYRPCCWANPVLNIHILFEVVSNISVLLVQGVGLSILLNHFTSTLELVAIIIMFVVVAGWVILILALPWEVHATVTEIPASPMEDSSTSNKQIRTRDKRTFWQSNKVEQDPKFMRTVENNRRHVDF